MPAHDEQHIEAATRPGQGETHRIQPWRLGLRIGAGLLTAALIGVAIWDVASQTGGVAALPAVLQDVTLAFCAVALLLVGVDLICLRVGIPLVKVMREDIARTEGKQDILAAGFAELAEILARRHAVPEQRAGEDPGLDAEVIALGRRISSRLGVVNGSRD